MASPLDLFFWGTPISTHSHDARFPANTVRRRFDHSQECYSCCFAESRKKSCRSRDFKRAALLWLWVFWKHVVRYCYLPSRSNQSYFTAEMRNLKVLILKSSDLQRGNIHRFEAIPSPRFRGAIQTIRLSLRPHSREISRKGC